MHDKFFGVVEGFYGKPYTHDQRMDLIEFLSNIGLNTYVYAPKNDIHHRNQWYIPYAHHQMQRFQKLNELSVNLNIHFNYALSPMCSPDPAKVIEKVKSMVHIGIKNYSIFFDDIEIQCNAENAKIQSHTANRVFDYLHKMISEPMLFFCPTQYHGFVVNDYIKTIAQQLHQNIEILWTGPKIVSKRISHEHIIRIRNILGRSPIVWDNLFANDYIPNTILRFPYRYRDKKVPKLVRGILVNPMNQYRESKPLIYTVAKYLHSPGNYVPKNAWREVRKRFSIHS